MSPVRLHGSYLVIKHLFIKIRRRVSRVMHISSISLSREEDGWGLRMEVGGGGVAGWQPRNRLFSNGQLPIIPAVINHRRLTNEVEQSARDGSSLGSSSSHCLLSSDWNADLQCNCCSVTRIPRQHFIEMSLHWVILLNLCMEVKLDTSLLVAK